MSELREGQRVRLTGDIYYSGSTGVIEQLVGAEPRVAIVQFDAGWRAAISTKYLEAEQDKSKVHDELTLISREALGNMSAVLQLWSERVSERFERISTNMHGVVMPVVIQTEEMTGVFPECYARDTGEGADQEWEVFI